MRRPAPFRLLPFGSLLALALLTAPAAADGLRGSGRGYLVQRATGLTLVRPAASATGARETPVELPQGAAVDEIFPLRAATLITAYAPAADDDGGTELVLALVSGDTTQLVAPPPGRPRGVSRENAVPLVSTADEMTALVWIEGPDRQHAAVRAAARTATGWSEVVTVAEAGPGSQLALAATALADGSDLLLWSRFDGRDDEIYFARRAAGVWSAPSRLGADNEVPDIVPAVVATGNGALAAWSRYDGHDYRLVVSRFAVGRWSEPESIGEPGSVFPSFERASEGVRLVYERAAPHGWAVVELDRQGRTQRRADLSTASPQRPVLVGDIALWADRELPLRWRSAVR
ncbi:MAG: hypothetical protein AB7G12_13030 [Thermoanaerobaculia bacterium]